LTDSGEKFDSSRDRGTKFTFEIGGGVIKGWNEGVKTMLPGEKCILRCRSDYAYGKSGSPPKIPSNANLDFEIEYFGKQEWPETHPVPHCFLKKGGSYLTPKEEGIILFDLTVYGDSSKTHKLYEEQNVRIEIGNDENLKIPMFVHQLLEKCAKNDVLFAKLDKEEHKSPLSWNVQTNEYFLKLKILEITNPPELWNMPLEKKKEEALRRKKRGNDLFVSGKIEKALRNYKKGIDAMTDLLKNDKKNDEPASKCEEVELFVKLQSNASMVCLKLKDNKSAIEHADRGLEYDSNNLKCLTRKAQALLMIGNFEKSKELINKCLEIDSDNISCQRLKSQCDYQIKLYKQKQKKLAKKMFG